MNKIYELYVIYLKTQAKHEEEEIISDLILIQLCVNMTITVFQKTSTHTWWLSTG